MDRTVSRLARLLFHPLAPSDSFLLSLGRYTVPTPAVHIPVEPLLQQRFPGVMGLYSRLVLSGPVRNLLYVFITLTADRKDAASDVRTQLKRGALGFLVSYFTPSEMILLKSCVETHQYNLIYRIYSNSLIYKKLRTVLVSPHSTVHRYFLDMIVPLLNAYERKVISSEYDLLLFHNNMYPIYLKLQMINRLNDIICDRLYFSTKKEECCSVSGFFTCDELDAYKDAIYRFLNECTREYFIMGSINDQYDEYFIKEHVVVPERIPSGVSLSVAEKIAYIGKYTCLLGSIEALEHTQESVALINSLDLSKQSSGSCLNEILFNINGLLYRSFIEKFRIIPLLEYIHDVFLFRRGDFAEYLFNSLKETRKSSKKSFLFILEEALESVFPASPFNSVIDVYVKEQQNNNSENRSFGEGFSLFCHLKYPISILLGEELILKLVYLFKFLWKIKKVDVLSRRIGSVHYLNLTQKFLFYVFYEVISDFTAIPWDNTVHAMDELHANLNEKLDGIMKRLFINTPEKKIELLLFHMEKSLVSAGRDTELVDGEVQNALKEFYEYAKESLGGTALHDIHLFIKK